MVYLHDTDQSIIISSDTILVIDHLVCKIHTILHTYHVTSLKGYGPTGGLVKNALSITRGIPRDSLLRDSEVGIIKYGT